MTVTSEISLGGLTVSRETFAALQTFEALVQRWGSAINLVSKSALADVWDRHIADSAQVFAFCPQSAQTWVDLGSGGGFPGIVVAVLAKNKKPDLRVTLVESDLRKATFLRQAAQTLDLNVNVVSERIESLRPLRADVLSARALAPLTQLLEYANHHLAESGVAIFAKGVRHAEEIAIAQTTWAFDLDVRSSQSDAEAAILVIRNIHRARKD
jgi:16S rRNA (guanine527-N7)-methyltransferase